MRKTKPKPLKPTGGLFEELLNEPRFGIKLHHATRLHFDVRFEFNGTTYSFVVEQGISRDPNASREAIFIDNTHRVSGHTWEGVFPDGVYGSGPMLTWDIGSYRHTTTHNGKPVSFETAFESGRIEFELKGRRLLGKYVLERRKDDIWVIRKLPDRYAVAGCSIARTATTSVTTSRTLQQIREENRPKKKPKPQLTGQLCLFPIGI